MGLSMSVHAHIHTYACMLVGRLKKKKGGEDAATKPALLSLNQDPLVTPKAESELDIASENIRRASPMWHIIFITVSL